jgi:hypothetical protein
MPDIKDETKDEGDRKKRCSNEILACRLAVVAAGFRRDAGRALLSKCVVKLVLLIPHLSAALCRLRVARVRSALCAVSDVVGA